MSDIDGAPGIDEIIHPCPPPATIAFLQKGKPKAGVCLSKEGPGDVPR